jgi:hypothetical protein
MEEQELKLVTVFSTDKDALMGVARSLLDDAGIEYEATNPYRSAAMDIKVRYKDEAQARSLLKGIGEETGEEEEIDSSYTEEPSHYMPVRESVVSESGRYSFLAILSFVIIVMLLAYYFVRC